MMPISALAGEKAARIETVTAVQSGRDFGMPDPEAGPDRSFDPEPENRLPAPIGRPEISTSRDLTVIAKPQATLVAQLLATHMGLPQTRTLRRAGAAHADAAYRQPKT